MMVIVSLALIMLVIIKVVWVICATNGHGFLEGEKKDIIRRANYLTSKVATSPQELLDEVKSELKRSIEIYK